MSSFFLFSCPFLPSGESSERPGAVKGACGSRRQQTVDGEDRSASIPQARKGIVEIPFFLHTFSLKPRPALSPPFHPHSG